MDSKGCMKIPEYIATYKELFAPLKDKPVTILELGVLSGASLLMWADYFEHEDSVVVGLDMSPPVNLYDLAGDSAEYIGLDQVYQYQGQQDDWYLTDSIAAKHGPFDIIIDDASHRRQPTETSFLQLKEHVKPGGFYVIEDWGTGYWDSSRGFDGAHYRGSGHNAGMVGLIKDLIDEIGSMDLPEEYRRPSEWKNLDIRWGQAILRKK